MQMIHRLHRGRAIVQQQMTARSARSANDGAAESRQVRAHSGQSSAWNLQHITKMLSRHNQRMPAHHRLNIQKTDNIRIFVQDVGGNLSRGDFAKYTLFNGRAGRGWVGCLR